MAKVSRAAITQLCESKLKPACHGKLIDVDDPVAQRYLASKDSDETTIQPSKYRAESEVTTTPLRPDEEVEREKLAVILGVEPHELPERIGQLADLSIREVGDKYGTLGALRGILDACKKIEDIKAKRLENEETEGSLISRELVKTHVFGSIDSVNRRLLSDSSKTIARRIYALANTGEPVEEAEKTVREILSSQLKPAKATAARVLRNA